MIYRPTFDLYHTIYRLTKILINMKDDYYIEIDRLRIFDFYLLFPSYIKKFRTRTSEKDLKKLINHKFSKNTNPYEIVSNHKILLEKMHTYHLSAIKCLASYSFINKEYCSTGKIKVINKEKLKSFLKNFAGESEFENNIAKFLVNHFLEIPLYGEHGIKYRSKLLESKYDAK